MMWRIMQIKENVIHWGQWRARWITASYIETVKYFEQIIMAFTSCICASIGRRKIKGAIIGMFQWSFPSFYLVSCLRNASERLQLFVLLVINYLCLIRVWATFTASGDNLSLCGPCKGTNRQQQGTEHILLHCLYYPIKCFSVAQEKKKTILLQCYGCFI